MDHRNERCICGGFSAGNGGLVEFIDSMKYTAQRREILSILGGNEGLH